MSSQDSNQTSQPHLPADPIVSQIQQSLRQPPSVASGLTPAFPVTRHAAGPGTTSTGNLQNPPVTREVDGYTDDGARVHVQATRQGNVLLRAQLRIEGDLKYQFDFQPSQVRVNGRETSVYVPHAAALNLGSLLESVVAADVASGAQLTQAVHAIRTSTGQGR